ncbi:MAG: hypothetical protein NC429_12170 [Lachnospiraceae bacterium]|nr:hypothetical protein [Lachnospiraceae bacterium]
MNKKRKNTAVIKMLTQLNPGKSTEKLYQDYQKKKTVLMGLMVIIGVVSAISLHLSSRMEARLAEGARITRNEWGAGDFKVTLLAQTEEWSRKINLSIRERQYTAAEKEKLIEDLRANIPDLIKGNNPDLRHVATNLNFVSTVKGYPFRIRWESNNPNRIRTDGTVNRENISKEGEWVTLTASVQDTQQEVREIFEINVFLMPETLTQEELFFRELEEELAGKEMKEDEKQIFLPQSLNGELISWQEQRQEYSFWVFLLFLLTAVLIGRGMDRDLAKNIQKRNSQLMAEYAGFVSMLRLYMMAGMTIKKAFAKIADDYGMQKRTQGKQYLYEEIKTLCYQLENGMEEEQVYQQWGQRCGEMRYRRLSFLLGVHLKQGNSQLLRFLEQEAYTAQEDRRNYARKAGEEAGTKLLLPMTIMLAVVMMLVLLPAYMGFGNI